METKNEILTQEECKTLNSMYEYWKEVLERDDKSPLSQEYHMIMEMLGSHRILQIIGEYATNEYALLNFKRDKEPERIN